MKVFIDTDVVLDFFAKREPYFQDAATIIDMAYRKEISLVVSTLTFTNLAAIMRRFMDRELAFKKLSGLIRVVSGVSSIEYPMVKKAVYTGRQDLETSVQYYSADSLNVDIIVTRNKRVFSDFDIPVQTPEEFVKVWTLM